MKERIIGRYDGSKIGPLLICIGGMHGNEPAGIESIQEALRLLKVEPELNNDFQYSGTFIGIRGNLSAIAEKRRFIGRDLNRMLTSYETDRIRNTPFHLRTIEDTESFELVETIEEEIRIHDPSLTLILDLHSTTADGGIFTIAADDSKSKELATGLHAPVILGISEGLIGTTIEYFNRPSSNCFCIVFEAGQHDDPECVHRSVAAIINCMRSIGSVKHQDVDHRHDGILISMSEGLPKISRLIYHYKLQPNESFIMKAGYKNFDPVSKGEMIASNQSGPIYAVEDGLILMPKYQSQGEDGFFIVKET